MFMVRNDLGITIVLQSRGIIRASKGVALILTV